MNYELAKQLKDAGFPYADRDGVKPYVFALGTETGEEPLIVPTLSELIEACNQWYGQQFRALIYDQGTWLVYPNIKEIKGYEPFGVSEDSPEEAVALFWLAFNKKDV